jgi:hypothetical protein
MAEPMQVSAARIRTAFNARDMDAFGRLLTEDARWGDDDAVNKCRSRSDVVATFQRLLTEGVDGEIVEAIVRSTGVVFRLSVVWRDGHVDDAFFHVYLISDGLITEIRRYDDADSALEVVSD